MSRRSSRLAILNPAHRRLTLLLTISLLVFGLAACAPGSGQSGLTPGAAQSTQSSLLPSPTSAQSIPTGPAASEATPTGAPATSAAGLSATPARTEAAPAVQMPDPAGYTWQEVANGLESPVGLFNAGDGSGRLFVLEQAGRIRIIQDGKVLVEAFLDITDRVGSQGNEQGLLGLAFHPQYTKNGFFYVNYTDQNGNTVIARFSVSQDPNKADPSSEKVLLRVDQPYPNHNGGATVFGPDGYLYLGLGDGGSAGDPQGNGQSLDTLLGKILRIDVNQGDPYAIPPDNPFASGGGKPEIWAYGLRNPWRFSFDRATGGLYIGDVGQDQWEEIDYLPAGSPGGANFGWNYREGSHPYEGEPPAGVQLIEPVAEYFHSQGCSVTGGYVYRGQALPGWQGVYLYGDFCSGRVWGLVKNGSGWRSAPLFDTGASITSFGEDEAGEIYLVDRSGSILKLVEK